MRTGPVSTPNERGPVARGQVKGSERNMDGGWGLHLAVGGVPRRQRLASVFGDNALMANSQHPS